jgi:hypothetical protein
MERKCERKNKYDDSKPLRSWVSLRSARAAALIAVIAWLGSCEWTVDASSVSRKLDIEEVEMGG